MSDIELKYLPIFREDLLEAITYIRVTLQNPKAANDLLDAVEQAILARSKYPDSFERYHSLKERKYPYYRIYVDNYVICYVLIPGDPNLMEMRRFLYCKRNRNFLI